MVKKAAHLINKATLNGREKCWFIKQFQLPGYRWANPNLEYHTTILHLKDYDCQNSSNILGDNELV
jgi:hypothetical protein